MTAKELINQEGYHFLNCENDVEKLMIKFAQYKVVEFVKQAAEKAEAYNIDEAGQTIFTDAKIDKSSILNSYNLNDIK